MNLFAYGTLMWPEVLEAVIGRQLRGEPVCLVGYQRLRVKGASYPAAVPSAGSRINGLLLQNLTDSDFECIDRFEGAEYERVSVGVAGWPAQLYVLSEDCGHIVEAVPWQPDDMPAEQLAAFCSEYKDRRKR